MGNDRVNKAGEKSRVYQIRHKLGPLGYGAAGYAGGGYGESPLVEKISVIHPCVGVGDTLQAEEVISDEAVGFLAGSEGKGEPEKVVEEPAGGGVEDVGEHDILGVLGAD
ncbi:unnamed protein product [Cuscuta europaea]|uniref:Uncharacterized protein n=1 Tax=Cuscuta europaea TaxID=41803 RepID=A0A9P0YQI3_CUSEU|nr:unnamed protein product [Cuscuta europaea]